MSKSATADVVIFGGGVAGLWALHRLHQAGYSAILFESNSLGGGQTHKAQGIIHGGMKYALTGKLTNDAKSVSAMPALWRACLAGAGEIDLSHVPVLSERHYLWSPNKFTSKLTGFLASKTLSAHVMTLVKSEYPTAFQNAKFKGEVYALDEIVVSVPGLVRELAKAHQELIYKIDALKKEDLVFDETGKLLSVTVRNAENSVKINAQQFIFAAGAGNEFIIGANKTPGVSAQRRALHMVLVKMPKDYPLYAHCLGFGARPRITITTHYTRDHESIWYLGGILAEEGVHRNAEEQIEAAKKELTALFSWIDFTHAEFSTFTIDRAEPKQKNNLKPETVFTKPIKNMLVAWPTKLALAPLLANHIVAYLKSNALQPGCVDVRELRAWPMPPLAKPIWEDVFCKNVV